MNYRLFNFCVFSWIALFLGGCRTCNRGILLTLGTIDSRSEVDTIEKYPNRNLYLVNIIHNATFGRFSMNYAVIENSNLSREILYNLNSPAGVVGRVSKRYIAYVKATNDLNWGWFRIKDGKSVGELPGMKGIIDSLRSAYPEPTFIKDVNGYIFLYLNGRVVKNLNYGQFVVANGANIDFDSMAYNLYRLDSDKLQVISAGVDDLFNQQSGVFYIPSPGYGIVSKYDKREILNAVDSVSRMNSPPSTIEIKPVP